jgi:nucleoid-associated protein YgaU
MSPQAPKDPTPTLQPSRSAGSSTTPPDFSNVQGHSDTVPDASRSDRQPDFSNVQAHADTVPASGPTGGSASTYTVQKGDTLSAIARQHYGKASHWHAIFEANRDQISDADLIRPGQVLKLPPG